MKYLFAVAVAVSLSCATSGTGTSAAVSNYDVVIRGGTTYDGSGNAASVTDIGVIGDSIVFMGDLRGARGKTEIDARGLAVSTDSSTC